MQIKEARFIASQPSHKECPKDGKAEYVFIGRSNVGKSTLINFLCNKKKLAKTSSTPGKTQLINYFLINEAWYLVDLPGYGYAKVSKTQRQEFQKMIKDYLTLREEITNVFLLIDSRIEPQKIDLEFIDWLAVNRIPFSIVFTKSDRRFHRKTTVNIKDMKMRLKQDWEELPPIFITSATDGTGKDEILNYISQVNAEISSM